MIKRKEKKKVSIHPFLEIVWKVCKNVNTHSVKSLPFQNATLWIQANVASLQSETLTPLVRAQTDHDLPEVYRAWDFCISTYQAIRDFISSPIHHVTPNAHLHWIFFLTPGNHCRHKFPYYCTQLSSLLQLYVIFLLPYSVFWKNCIEF